MNILVGNMLASILNEVFQDYKSELEAVILVLLSQIEGGDIECVKCIDVLLKYFKNCLGF